MSPYMRFWQAKRSGTSLTIFGTFYSADHPTGLAKYRLTNCGYISPGRHNINRIYAHSPDGEVMCALLVGSQFPEN